MNRTVINISIEKNDFLDLTFLYFVYFCYKNFEIETKPLKNQTLAPLPPVQARLVYTCPCL